MSRRVRRGEEGRAAETKEGREREGGGGNVVRGGIYMYMCSTRVC